MESRRVALILILTSATALVIAAALTPAMLLYDSQVISAETEYDEVQLLFPDPQMSTKSNSTVLAQHVADSLNLGKVTKTVEVLNPFTGESSWYYSHLYGPLTVRAPPALEDLDYIPYDEHVMVCYSCNESDLMLIYGGNHSDALLIALILATDGLNMTGEDEAARETASASIVESIGIAAEMVSSVAHIEDEYYRTVVLSGEIQGAPFSWCNLACVKFSNPTLKVQQVVILPFVSAEQSYFSLTSDEAAAGCEQAIESELKDSYKDSEFASIRLVMVREIIQGAQVDEFNATFSEVFKFRLGYEFNVTVEDSNYHSDVFDLVVIDCNDGSTLLVVEGPQPIGGRPLFISLPLLMLFGGIFVLLFLLVSFETSPEFAALILQFFIMPVYMRIRGAQALDSFNRGRIFEHIRVHPGSFLSTLKSSLGMGNGTLAYHLSVLQRLELIRSEKTGSKRRYYVCGVNHQVKPDTWLGKTEAQVLEELVANGPMSISKVAEQLQISRQRAHYNMRLLLKRGMAVHERPLWRAVYATGDGPSREA